MQTYSQDFFKIIIKWIIFKTGENGYGLCGVLFWQDSDSDSAPLRPTKLHIYQTIVLTFFLYESGTLTGMHESISYEM